MGPKIYQYLIIKGLGVMIYAFIVIIIRIILFDLIIIVIVVILES